MGAIQKRKGKSGEQELARLLRKELDDAITRNLQQAQKGGADLEGTPWILEVKRSARPRITTWWTQACNQASAVKGCPCLAWRIDRGEWRFRLPLGAVHQGFDINDVSLVIETDFSTFVAITKAATCTRRATMN